MIFTRIVNLTTEEDLELESASPNVTSANPRRADICDRTSDACLQNGQSRILSDDGGNATIENRGIQTPEPMEHHCEWYRATHTLLKTAFLKIAGGKRVETTIALPHWLTTEYQEENYAAPKQADVLAEQDFAEKI